MNGASSYHTSLESENEGSSVSRLKNELKLSQAIGGFNNRPQVTAVDLGFIESDPDEDAFSPQVFPSKVGGKPVWLDPRCVLGSDMAKCEVCTGPLLLLAQLYAPIPNREKDAYHRTIYVFMCPRSECCSRNSNNNFVVFRSQLPEDNAIYAYEDAPDDVKESYERAYHEAIPPLCEVCGMLAPFRCAKCKVTSYCCRLHQTQHWQSGGHKGLCIQLQNSNQDPGIKSIKLATKANNLALPEFELYIEPEPTRGDAQQEIIDNMKDLDLFTKEQTEIEEEDSNLESEVNGASKKDPAFSRFLKRIKRRPSQVVRYELGNSSSTPLWPSSLNQPDSIPDCELCGARRRFEFQIMPQLLTYLLLEDEPVGGNGIDWATLAIYSCSANCPTMTADKKPCCAREFLWKQDYSD